MVLDITLTANSFAQFDAWEDPVRVLRAQVNATSYYIPRSGEFGLLCLRLRKPQGNVDLGGEERSMCRPEIDREKAGRGF